MLLGEGTVVVRATPTTIDDEDEPDMVATFVPNANDMEMEDFEYGCTRVMFVCVLLFCCFVCCICHVAICQIFNISVSVMRHQ